MVSDILHIFREYYILWIYSITLFVALWRYPRYYDSPLKFFPLLLMYTLLNETFGALIYRNEQIRLIFSDYYSFYNWAIYNVYGIIFYLFFFYVYWCYISNSSHRKLIVYGSILYGVASIINPFFQNFLLESQLYSYILGALILICLGALYFLDLKSKYDKWFLRKDLLSWLSLGVIIFYLGYIPIKILRHYEVFLAPGEAIVIRNIHWGLILLMYGSFVLGFVLMRRRRTTITV
ncbi:hypothetical protein [Muriicola sp. Z0-33]|uniref:hypothetical protein n=1 Tax=Muriicola sp. Z0-33 TaxID=2816957 RepID=UPI002237CB28|nr:hypothetical protein [Muriicola sp. Z0-33]MCW5517842.1 hypothetical protein [Muriicola sp. Z0-33]